VEAENEQEALNRFERNLLLGVYDSANFECEEDYELNEERESDVE